MAQVLSTYARRRIAQLAPKSALGRISLYLLVMDLLLYVANKVLGLVSPATAARSGLSGWVSFLTFALLVLGCILAFRWMREKLLWRLRNRLIVTYVFIGVIPVLLIATIAAGAGYLFAGQFATYLATSDIHSELRALEAANASIAAEYARSLATRERNPALPALHEAKSEGRWTERQVTAWYGDTATLLQGPAGAAALSRPAWAKDDFSSVTFDSKGVYLRVSNTLNVAGKPLTIVSSEPLDAARLQEITANFGEITITDIGTRASKPAAADQSPQSGFRITTPDPSQQGAHITVNDETATLDQAAAGVHMPKVTAGTVPPASASLDPEFSFISLFPVTDWNDGKSHTEGLIVHSRASALYGRLFRTLGQLTQIIIYAIAGTAIFFAIIELFALFIGLGLTRTITRSVAELYKGTQHVNRGDFSYRIPVRSRDQLAELETSFNSMNESLERLIADQKEKQRLENELAIAQEVQAQLFPKQTTEMESLEVFGVCQPARTVSGDYYDFLPLGPERLGIAVGDISGKGISAALLMATVHSAVRAYEFGRMPAVAGHLVAAGGASTHVLEVTSGTPPDGFSPANVLSVLNRQLYHSTPTEKYATLFLSVYDARSRTLNYSNAGHLPPIIIRKDRSLRRLDTAGLVVGLFDAQSYGEESVSLAPGEVFLAYSDGVTEPENEFGEFGEERLIEIVRDHRHLPLAEIAALVTSAVKEWIGHGEQPDDITIVLARPR